VAQLRLAAATAAAAILRQPAADPEEMHSAAQHLVLVGHPGSFAGKALACDNRTSAPEAGEQHYNYGTNDCAQPDGLCTENSNDWNGIDYLCCRSLCTQHSLMGLVETTVFSFSAEIMGQAF
jgi:hypothetical protein